MSDTKQSAAPTPSSAELPQYLGDGPCGDCGEDCLPWFALETLKAIDLASPEEEQRG